MTLYAQGRARLFSSGLTWGEGPRWHQGALWVSDTQGNLLWTDASGTWAATSVPSSSNGLWFLPDGRLAGAMMREKRIATWDSDHWQPLVDLSHVADGPMGDMVGDADGNLYVDDVGFDAGAGAEPVLGRVLLVRTDGSVEVAATALDFPNGLALLDGGETLVVAETRAQRLTAFTVEPDGRLTNRRVYADIAALAGPDARPDGIWPAPEGLWVATTTGQCVVRVSEAGLHEKVDFAPEFPIACTTTDANRLIVTVAETSGVPLMEALAGQAVTTRVVIVEQSAS